MKPAAMVAAAVLSYASIAAGRVELPEPRYVQAGEVVFKEVDGRQFPIYSVEDRWKKLLKEKSDTLSGPLEDCDTRETYLSCGHYECTDLEVVHCSSFNSSPLCESRPDDVELGDSWSVHSCNNRELVVEFRSKYADLESIYQSGFFNDNVTLTTGDKKIELDTDGVLSEDNARRAVHILEELRYIHQAIDQAIDNDQRVHPEQEKAYESKKAYEKALVHHETREHALECLITEESNEGCLSTDRLLDFASELFKPRAVVHKKTHSYPRDDTTARSRHPDVYEGKAILSFEHRKCVSDGKIGYDVCWEKILADALPTREEILTEFRGRIRNLGGESDMEVQRQ